MARLFGREDRRRHELLSAYVDGEVTPEEAREVEELLETSEAARRELAELQATVDLVRGLPELEPPRSFALDEAPKKRWTLWWPSVRTTGLATSVAAMLLVALVAGEMLNVLEQARFGADDSEYASDESAFPLLPAPAPESMTEAVMDAPTTPEPEVASMQSDAAQDEPVSQPAAPAAAAPAMAAAKAAEDAPQEKIAESSEEPVAAMQQVPTEGATQSAETQSSEESLVAAKQVAEDEAPQADEVESVEARLTEAQQKMEEESREAIRQLMEQGEHSPMDEFDEPASEGITLPLVEFQVVTAIVVVVLVGATLVAVLRRRRSVL